MNGQIWLIKIIAIPSIKMVDIQPQQDKGNDWQQYHWITVDHNFWRIVTKENGNSNTSGKGKTKKDEDNNEKAAVNTIQTNNDGILMMQFDEDYCFQKMAI